MSVVFEIVISIYGFVYLCIKITELFLNCYEKYDYNDSDIPEGMYS